MTRRRFTQEYQDQAVGLVLHSGRTVREVTKSIGVHEITLGKWVNKARGGDSDRDEELSETERADLERLSKENAVLRMERDFAKKVRPGSLKNSREICGDRGLGAGKTSDLGC